jgi:AcrR family transcriptional regulator
MPSPASGLKTRHALLVVAKQYLGDGNRDVTIQQLARDAQVSVGSLYTHFSDKTDLFNHAAEASLLGVVPELEYIAAQFEDPTLGFLCSVLFHCHRTEFDPETARIILNAGPIGFAKFDEHRTGPIKAINVSMELGLNTCTDAEAFFYAVAGAFQEVLAQYFLATASPHLAERVMRGLAAQVGYSDKQFDDVHGRCEEFIALRKKTGAPLTSRDVLARS